jgi:hypothetical protein
MTIRTVDRHDWRQDGQQEDLSNKTFSSLVSCIVVGSIDRSIRLYHVFIYSSVLYCRYRDIVLCSGRFQSLPASRACSSFLVLFCVISPLTAFSLLTLISLHSVLHYKLVYYYSVIFINFSFVTHLFECTIIRMTFPFVAQRKFSPAWVPSTSVPRFEPKIYCMRGGQARSVHNYTHNQNRKLL